MSRRMFWIGASLLVLMQVGCMSRGFNRGELQQQIGVVKPAFDDKEIEKAYNKKPLLPKPFKLAVFFKSPKSLNRQEPAWRWSDEDKDLLGSAVAELKAKGIVSDVFPIVSSVVADEDLKSLRLAAAQHGADALLIIGGAGEIDRYINKWGWSYALLLPAFLVPGSEADTLFVANAAMFDVKNEYLYLTAEAEAITKETYVAAFDKSDKALLKDAKTQAIGRLKAEIEKMVAGKKL